MLHLPDFLSGKHVPGMEPAGGAIPKGAQGGAGCSSSAVRRAKLLAEIQHFVHSLKQVRTACCAHLVTQTTQVQLTELAHSVRSLN